MISLIAFVIGAIFGAFSAKKRGGNVLDILLYSAVYGVILAILALFITIALVRFGWI